MNKPGILLAALLILMGSLRSQDQEVVEAIVAVVNDEIITLSDFKTQHDVLYRELRNRIPGEEFQEQYEFAAAQLLDDMIMGIILLQKARELDLDVSEQVNMFIEDIKKKNGIQSDAQLRAAFEQQGVDYETWLIQMRESYMRDMAVYAEVGRSIVVDDGEIFTYYRQHPEEFTDPPKYTLRGIFVSGEDKSAEDAEAKKREILGLLEGGGDFGSLAGSHSEGPNKDNQGDLGTFNEGDMLDAFEQEVSKLETGGLTPWISIQSGWYLLRLEEKVDSQLLAFDDVRDQIQQKIFTERSQAERIKYLEKLKAASFIQILIADPLERIERGP